MSKPKVAIVKYENPLESVRQAIELTDGFKMLNSNAKVFIKPNIVFWTKATDFPKYGVITTSRVMEDGSTAFIGTGVPMLAASLAQSMHAPNLIPVFEFGGTGAILEKLPLAVGDMRTYNKGVADSDLITKVHIDPVMGGTGMRGNFVTFLFEQPEINAGGAA